MSAFHASIHWYYFLTVFTAGEKLGERVEKFGDKVEKMGENMQKKKSDF